MRPSEIRRLHLRIEQRREAMRRPPPVVEATRPSVLRLLLMVIWAKITGAGG